MSIAKSAMHLTGTGAKITGIDKYEPSRRSKKKSSTGKERKKVCRKEK